ncbi:MAG: PD40 domain-containing protein [Proteobacteria bacterium]|nr:PD40 domain-containing protein [Pseudomonadota bacterium]
MNRPHTDADFTVTEGTWMSVAVSPDGRAIAFDLLGDIYEIPAAGGDAQLLQGGPAMQRTPRYSPDGQSLLFLSDASGSDNLWISKADGSQPRQVTHETTQIMTGPAWGAGGTFVAGARLYASADKLHNSEIRLYDLAGGAGQLLVPMPTVGENVHEAQFSPDGRYVYYTEKITPPHQSNIYIDANHENFEIKRREIGSGETEGLIGGFGGATTPEPSPDGRYIAFVRRVEAKTVLFRYDIATREQTPLFAGLDRDDQSDFIGQGNYYPQFGWFPDSRHVAIWGRGKLFKVDMQTGEAVPIPFTVHAHHQLVVPPRFRHELVPKQITVKAIREVAYAPDGRSVVFQALGHLWRKTLPGGKPERLTNGSSLEFDPVYSPDGRSVAFVEWNDERKAQLRIESLGHSSRTVVASAGVLRSPAFSRDGTRLLYEISEGDRCLGGHDGEPGMYWLDLRDGVPHRIAGPGEAPMFAPDGQRAYHTVSTYTDHDLITTLESVDLSGNNKRVHAATRDADTSELRISPDLHWLAFRDRQQYYLVPYRETGSPLRVAANSTEAPVTQLTKLGGYALTWSSDSKVLHWLLGPTLYTADAREQIVSGATEQVGLVVPPDIPSGTLAFTHARLITMVGEQVIENGTVVVRGNRIVAVGPADQVAVPADAKVVPADGKTIMPGLVDMHGHIDNCYYTSSGLMPQKQPSRYADLAYGVTTNYDPYTSELPTYSMSEMTETGDMVGPRGIDSGMVAYGRPGKADSAYLPIDSVADAQAFMARKNALGGTIVKSYRQPMRSQRQELIEAGREAGVMVDVEGESHFYNNLTMILDGNTNLQHNMPVPTYYDDVVQLMAHGKVSHTPTLVVLFGETMGENYLYQTTRSWEDPKLQKFVQVVTSGYSSIATPYGAPPYVRNMTTINVADELWDIGFRSTARSMKKLDDAGVVINSGSHGQVAGLAMHWEMWLLSQGGMSNYHVLRTGTINGARTLALDDQIGSLEVGKLADLLVLDGNPLADIHNTNTVRYTMVNGRLYDSQTLNEIGHYNRPRGKFFWELQSYKGFDWNGAWAYE